MQTGTTYLQQVQKLAGAAEVRNYPGDSDARMALASGRADAWVSDRFVALEVLRREPQLKLHAGELLLAERIAAAAARGNAGLVQAWNQALAAVQADGSYAALSRKYFGEDVRCR